MQKSIKSSLWTNSHAIKEYGGVEEKFQTFLMLVIDGKEKFSYNLTFRTKNISRDP
jgi:hypothetical protein